MTGSQERTSVYRWLGLPDKFGVVLLTLGLILLVAPYLGGTEFGIFQVPAFDAQVNGYLRWAGPLVFAAVVLLFVPLVPGHAVQPNAATKRRVAALVGRLKHANARTRRAAALDLGKLGGAAESAIPDLIQALNDPDSHVRENAARALEAGGSAAIGHLIAALRHQKGLALAGPAPRVPRDVPPLRNVMGEEHVREALVAIGPDAVPALVDALKHGAPELRAPVAAALKRIQTSALDDVIARAASDEDDEVRLGAAIALAENASAADVSALAALLQDTDARVRVCAIAGLGRTGSREAVPLLAATLSREADSKVRYEIVRALRALAQRHSEAIPPMIAALEDASLMVRLAAVMELGELGPPAAAALPALTEALSDPDEKIREHAARTLTRVRPS